MDARTELLKKIESNTAVIGVIGLGYVGLPLLRAFHQAGFPVLGFDVDPSKILALSRGENYLRHLGADVPPSCGRGRLSALTPSPYPRPTREVMLPRFEARGLKLAQDSSAPYPPEREAPARRAHTTQPTPKPVGGLAPASGDIAV